MVLAKELRVLHLDPEAAEDCVTLARPELLRPQSLPAVAHFLQQGYTS